MGVGEFFSTASNPRAPAGIEGMNSTSAQNYSPMNTLRAASPRSFRAVAAFLVGAGLAPFAVFAGTPLICHPYAIGNAATLPGSDGDWKGVNPTYDRNNVARDTLALLTPAMPVVVRMETLRRAAIYATAGMRGWDKGGQFNEDDRTVALGLLAKLRDRTKGATGEALALATFDAGFFAETLRQTRVDPTLDGYAMLKGALELRGRADAEMEFALALASAWPKRKEHSGHLSRARAGAMPNSMLAVNLASHLGGQ